MVTIKKEIIKGISSSNNLQFSKFEQLINQSFLIDGKIKIEGEETVYTENEKEALLNRMNEIKNE